MLNYDFKYVTIGLLLLSTCCLGQGLTKYIQPMAGTASATTASALKHGAELTNANYANAIPAVTMPFGMTQWTPQTQTGETKCVPPYYYKDVQFSGLRGSHWLSGSCTQDYGSFTIMPITGKLKLSNYEVPFIHADEVSHPYLYKINLKKYQLQASVTATPRCGMMQFKVEKADSLYLLIKPNSDYNEGFIQVDTKRGEVYGYNPVHRIYQGWGNKAGFSGYFVIKFEHNIAAHGTFSGENSLTTDSVKDGKAIGAYVGFKLKKGENVIIRIGTSFTSLAGARKNLQAEMSDFKFDEKVRAAKALWENALARIQVSTNILRNKKIFYTACYHTMQQPRLFNDVDGLYPRFSSFYHNENLKKGNYYDDFSMWDIYRAEIPLYELLDPQLVNDMVRSLIIKGKQGAWMPIFPCWNSYTSEMIGDHATSVISSAYLKGIRDYDVDEAYHLLRHNAFDIPANKEDYKEGKGRRALDSYLKYHYIPLEDSVPDAFHKKEQVSRTMEYAYDDYALAQFAKGLKKFSDYNQLINRAGYYKNVFNTRLGFVRGKDSSGNWSSPFYPDKKVSYITEGTPRQYTFYVPHDIPGLTRLLGGKNKLEQALDSLFIKNEYWHGNEPGHQIPFMYNFTNAPWKTQAIVSKILAAEYSDGPGGLGGNDDAGQMSAWYIFASIGLYPVNPISGEYQLCTPLFNQVTINLTNKKTFKIITHKKNKNSAFISRIVLNGKLVHNYVINYKTIISGGKMDIYLTSRPAKN